MLTAVGVRGLLRGFFGKKTAWASLLGWALFVGLVGYGSYRGFLFLDSLLELAPLLRGPLYETIMASVTLGSLAFLFLGGGVRVFWEVVYDSADLPFLLATPLSPRVVFANKFLEAMLTLSITVMPLTFAAWVGFGLAISAPMSLYLLAFLGQILGVSLVVGLSSAFLIVVMRFVPGARMRQFLMSLGLVLGLAIVLGSQVLSTWMAQVQPDQLLAQLEAGEWLVHERTYWPHQWMARLPLSVLPTNPFSWQEMGYLLMTSLLSLGGAFALAGPAYLEGWMQNQAGEGRTRPRRTWGANWPQTPFFGILRKDLLVLIREPFLWYNYGVGVIVLAFFIYNLARQDSFTRMPLLFYQGVLLFMTLMATTAGGGLIGGMSLSREGRSWWWLQGSPIRPSTLYLAKLVYGFLPNFTFASLATLIIWVFKPMPALPLWASLPLLFFLVLGVQSVQVGLDLLAPNFSVQLGAGKKSEAGGGGVKIFIGNILGLVMVAMTGLTFMIPVLAGEWALTARIPSYTLWGVATGLLVLETLGISFIFYLVCQRRLARLLQG